MDNEKNSVAMIKRTFEILDFIFENKGQATFPEIKDTLDIPKATIFRILSTLEQEHIIIKNQQDHYSLGKIFAYYGEAVKAEMSLLSISRQLLEDLARETGETINLNILYQDIVLNLFSVEGEESILSSKLIPLSPLNCSSTGKLFLAQKTLPEIKSYFEQNKYEARTVNSITDAEAFMDAREVILLDGYASDDEEYEYGLFCMGVPVMDCHKKMVAGISLSAPKARIFLKDIESIKKQLKTCAQEISEIMMKAKISY